MTNIIKENSQVESYNDWEDFRRSCASVLYDLDANIEILTLWIGAIEATIAKHEVAEAAEEDYVSGGSCPLCHVARRIDYQEAFKWSNMCVYCPWILATADPDLATPCEEVALFLDDIYIGDYRDNPTSITRLTIWLDITKAALAEQERQRP